MGIYDTMRELERIGKKIKMFTLVPVLFIAVGFIFILCGSYSLALAIILVGAFVSLVYASNVPFLKQQYTTLYKETFVVSVLKTMLDDVKYDCNDGFTEFDIMQSGLIKIGNQLSSEDYLSGSYKGVKFRQADVDSINETWNGEEKETVTYFSGRLIEFEYPLKLTSSVKVLSNYFTTYLSLPSEIIDMEDVEFNDEFNVYALDAHEAFYILTPPLIEKLKYIKKYCNIFAFNFAQGKIYFALQNKKVFEIEYKDSISYVDEQDRMKQDVQTIIDAVNMLGLI